ncbi:MAG: ammonium transporter [Bdellovibrionota bacterium]
MNIEILWLLLCSFMVFMMQAGFLCLEAGLTRTKNSINTAAKNVADFGVSAVLFIIVGFHLMYEPLNVSEIFSLTSFKTDDTWFLTFFLFQLLYCATAGTIISGANSERITFRWHMMLTAIIAGILYPVFGRWTWSGIHYGSSKGWLMEIGFIDFAGSSVVHFIGGALSLAVLLVIGPRFGRFPVAGKPRRISGSNLPMAIAGSIILAISWIGFNSGSNFRYDEMILPIIFNTVLGGVGGLILPLLYYMIKHKEPINIVLIMNGMISGLVAITASCHMVSPYQAIIIGAIGMVSMGITSRLLEKFKIDDAVDAVPVHLGGGAWGTLAVAIFGSTDRFTQDLSRIDQLGVQLLGIIVAFLWAFFIPYIFLRVVNRYIPLRVSLKDELSGLNYSEHGETTEIYRLLEAMREQESSGDLSKRIAEEPHTEIGEIARQYNKVIDSLESATKPFFRTIFEQVNEGIIIVNRMSIITHCNEEAEHIFAVSANNVIGSSIKNLLPSLFNEENFLEKSLLLLSNSTISERDAAITKEIKINRNDQDIDLSISICPIMTDLGPTFTLIIRDISKNKAFEVELLRLKEQAEKANQLKDQFVGLVAHDLKSPLGLSINYLQISTDSSVPFSQSQVTANLNIALKSCYRMNTLIDDILSLTRLRSGASCLNKTLLCIDEVVVESVKNSEFSLEKKNIKIVTDIDDRATVFADRALLREVISNLISNAVKFSHNNSTIDIFQARDDSHTISIRDHGVGMSDEVRETLMGASAIRSTKGTKGEKGSGLGLTICKEIISAHSGVLYCDSQLGKGSTFKISLKKSKPNIGILRSQNHYHDRLGKLLTEHLNAEVVYLDLMPDSCTFVDFHLDLLIVTNHFSNQNNGNEKFRSEYSKRYKDIINSLVFIVERYANKYVAENLRMESEVIFTDESMETLINFMEKILRQLSSIKQNYTNNKLLDESFSERDIKKAV